jgi:hypothetical protein
MTLQSPAQATDLPVSVHGEPVIVPGDVLPLPEFPQRELQQRQRARLAMHLADQQIGQPRIEPGTDQFGRPQDGFAQLDIGHGPDQRLVRRDRVGQGRILGTLAAEVGPHRQDHQHRTALDGGRVQQVVDERLPIGLLLAELGARPARRRRRPVGPPA